MQEYEFIYSEQFLIETFRRHRRTQRAVAFSGLLIKTVLSLPLLALLALLVHVGSYPGAAVILIFLLLLVFSQSIDEWLIRRRFRKSPYRDEHYLIQLSSDGFSAQGTRTSSLLTWTVFTAARRFDDGFLLFQGPGVFNWLPGNAITKGTVEKTDELIRVHIPDYKRA